MFCLFRVKNIRVMSYNLELCESRKENQDYFFSGFGQLKSTELDETTGKSYLNVQIVICVSLMPPRLGSITCFRKFQCNEMITNFGMHVVR